MAYKCQCQGVGFIFLTVLIVAVTTQTTHVGDACPDPQCTGLANGICDGAGCICQPDFYDPGDKSCQPKIAPGGNCSGNPSDECVGNANCSSRICTCGSDYFANNGVCIPRIPAGQTCSSSVPDPKQCVDNAHCQGSACTCSSDFFNKGGACSARLRAGHTCKSEAECVEHANCTVRATGHPLCTCTKGYPEQGSGLCG
ncbi:hypothetical protein BaRGS_00011406, partial [Batillaria attramentaria]